MLPQHNSFLMVVLFSRQTSRQNKTEIYTNLDTNYKCMHNIALRYEHSNGIGCFENASYFEQLGICAIVNIKMLVKMMMLVSVFVNMSNNNNRPKNNFAFIIMLLH